MVKPHTRLLTTIARPCAIREGVKAYRIIDIDILERIARNRKQGSF